ncbi:glycine-rich RNA-binding protein 4, mitochondrial isoform X1 [Amborella trichopoda]|uniref:RRM domain-containing protein n=1 Tax=Amborella trichopoda TaxID=13333 RepID=W1PSH0_AMBTC|nr:glycine-rich RNA-binding protein 4, mitochondrial isoform X1 [Amborella trichopoda]ERN10180.1 hypothetical protein AMTR_s00168p00066520 [Amborella trichopoda]|eukprot:XP_006848599.1 glycine-rich RNA-binding protein 4, mitochondrial isoform X1 [Amborella trichopoda]
MGFFLGRTKIISGLAKPLLLSNRPAFSRGFSSELFVSRLSFYSTEQSLKDAFSPFGEVIEARLVIDKATLRPKGYGFIRYQSEIEAQKAMKAMDGRFLGGRLIFVEVAKPRPEVGDDASQVMGSS